MKDAIEIKNLNVSYGKHTALRDISLSVEEGEYLGIMGPNGSGKSTLLKAILGLVPAKSGEIRIFGNTLHDNKKILGYVPQFSDLDRSFPISVGEVVLTSMQKGGLHPFFRFSKQQREEAEKSLEAVGLSGYSDRSISQLSGGELQRLLIARALAAGPSVLLLDEPTASVDPKSRELIYGLLGKLNKKITIIMVTHDMTAISSEVKKLACLNETLVYHGEPRLTEKVVSELYGCPVDLIAHGLPHRVLKEHDGGEHCC